MLSVVGTCLKSTERFYLFRFLIVDQNKIVEFVLILNCRCIVFSGRKDVWPFEFYILFQGFVENLWNIFKLFDCQK
jgi:hypothetical protein